MFSKLLILLLYVEVVSGAVITSPTNAAVEDGGSVTLSYKSSITTPAPTWIFNRGREAVDDKAITAGCQVDPSFATHYNTTSGTGGECNLIIRNSTLEQGGIYTCVSGAGTDRRSALLTVVDITLSINNTTEVVEGDRLNVSCLVQRSTTQAPQQPLNLNWNAAVGPNISNSLNESSLSSSGIVTAGRSSLPSYTCSISFGSIVNIPTATYATNVPSEVFTKGSTAFDVQYCPSEPVVGDSTYPLVCRADANPPASYAWVDQTYGNTSSGPELTPKHSGTYNCNATTTIRGRVCYNTTDYNVTDATGKSTEPSSDDNHRNAIIIGVVVGVGVPLIIALIITVVCCCCKKNKKTDTQKGEEEFDNMRMERTGDLNYQALNVLPTQPQETYQELKQTPVERTGRDFENQAQYENTESL